jgi:hypothetical protein
MTMRALPLSPAAQSSSFGAQQSIQSFKKSSGGARSVRVYAKADGEESKQSLFGSITEALDLSQVRSEDADLLYEARESTKGGGRMTREQVYMRMTPLTNNS